MPAELAADLATASAVVEPPDVADGARRLRPGRHHRWAGVPGDDPLFFAAAGAAGAWLATAVRQAATAGQ